MATIKAFIQIGSAGILTWHWVWKPTDDSWLNCVQVKVMGAAYAGRSMDGSQFKRESLGLHAEQKYYRGDQES